ncbi:MAG: head decoration protein [Desulfarculus sp.]|nr:head decoration protein [Desulfarculus sp.]
MPLMATEGNHLGDIVKQEAQGRYSREAVTVLAGAGQARVLEIGSVLGRITKGAATAAAVAGNTGGGAAGAVTLGAKAKLGAYTLTCITAAAGGGVFKVVDPDGIRLGNDLTVGQAYVGDHINLTVSDGAPDFAVGDKFTVTVAGGAGKAKAVDFAATDGSQQAAGVLIAKVTAPDGVDATGVAIVRDAVIAPSKLAWPAGATSDQKTAALAQLKALGIITREEA